MTVDSSNRYQSWEVVDPEKWVPDGYVCVRVDSRGAGRSPGYMDLWSARETKDYYNCIEWAAVQPWSNGKVGLNGISYYGMNQWQVAALAAPPSGGDLHLGGRRRLLSRTDPSRGHPFHLCRQLVRHAGQDGPARGGKEGIPQRHGGRLGGRAGDADARGARGEPRRFRRGGLLQPPEQHRVLAVAAARLFQDQGPPALGGQLGRSGDPPAGELRGIHALRLPAEMAGGARVRALDGILCRFRQKPSETVLRPFPQGGGHGMVEAAQGPAQGAPHRQVRREGGE